MYIAISGNIGSGKTSLTEILTERLGATPLYEEIANPYIADFYEDMRRWSFNFQVYFLGSRMNQGLRIRQAEGTAPSTRMPTSLPATSTKWG